MDEQGKKAATAAEVMERFKAVGKEVEYNGCTFKIKKVSAMMMLAEDMLAIPFLRELRGKWKDMAPEDRLKESKKIMAEGNYKETIRRESILQGVVEPKFSVASPCPEDLVDYNTVDEELKDFLSDEVLKFSGFDKKADGFFRPSAGTPATGT